MRLPSRPWIDIPLSRIQKKRERLDWLRPFGIEGTKIVHFGCANGYETIALMWEFRATEVVGLDIKQSSIDDAQKWLSELRKAIRQSREYVTYWGAQLSRQDLGWWHRDVPAFLKDLLMSERHRVEYVRQDITHRSCLVSDYYDLVFADFVLHHIWLDQTNREGEKEASRDTRAALSEMARVTRPGGFVAAYELTRQADSRALDFEPLFREVGLERVHIESTELADGEVTKYLFTKPS